MKVEHKPVDHCVATACHLPNGRVGRFRKHDWYGRAWVIARWWARGQK